MAISLVGCLHTTESSQRPAVCLQKPEAGHCRAAFKKYFYNNQTQSCEMFIWGGCGGNVPFETLQQCRKVCR